VIKRLFDFIVSGVIILGTLPLWLPYLIFSFRHKERKIVRDENGELFTIVQYGQILNRGIFNKILLSIHIFLGNLSFVGAPIRMADEPVPDFFYKPGLTGLYQINRANIRSKKEGEQYELYYLKNQNFWLDIEIIIKSIMIKTQ
jgi:lipopolysaccharide/colanic/teichoic acid biosynthesis glycosyltransferase